MGDRQMIYFDQAASSFPKPPEVALAMVEAVNEYGANPGRSGHQLARKAALIIEETRNKLAELFQAEKADHIIFSQNATTALNQAIFGLAYEKGDHIITTSFEHNSIRRPLEKLAREEGVIITYLEPDENGSYQLEHLKASITEKTKLVAVTHGSNVTGAIFPIEQWGSFLKEQEQIKFLVDASQTAGVLPIQMKDMGIDLLAFPGHKGLLGPQGVGILIVNPKIDLKPMFYGGTGAKSEDPLQPKEWPTGWESGTLNTPGIAGLSKGIDAINAKGLTAIYEHERQLALRCIEGLKKISGMEIFKSSNEEDQLGVVSFRIKGIDVHEIAYILDEHYQIAVRAGLHCAPLTHEYLKTLDTGLVRVSFGMYNTFEEVDTFLQALTEIVEGLSM